MEKTENQLRYIPLWENKDGYCSSAAIPFKDVKEVMGKQRYLRVNLFKNKAWSKANSNRPKWQISMMGTTTEKEIEFDEVEESNIGMIRDSLENIITLAMRGQENCDNYDDVYHRLCNIEEEVKLLLNSI